MIDECQNPVYPDDRFLTDEQKSTKARAVSVTRAISPGERVCIVDYDQFELDFGDEQDPTPHYKSHSYSNYMQWRHDHIDPRTGQIPADGEPWTPWLTADQWAEIAPPRPPPVPQPNPPVGWLPRVRVVPNGISQMDGPVFGFTPGWLGFTFVTQTRPVPVTVPSLWPGGSATRITLFGSCELLEVYIAPLIAANQPFVADPDRFFQLTFDGIASVSIDGEIVSDPLPHGIDGSTGFLVSGFVSAGEGYLGTREVETEWFARSREGNWAAQYDKSVLDEDPTVGWTEETNASSICLMIIEGYYPVQTP